MLFLIISIVCSSMLNIVMRFSEGRVQARTGMLCFNYLTCMLLGLAHMGFDVRMAAPGGGAAVGLGVINGLIYVLGLVLMQYNIRSNGVVLPSVFSRLGGLLVPLAVSMCFFHEMPGVLQAVGAALALAAIVLISERKGEAVGAMGPLLLLFLSDGMAGAMSKIYGETGNALLESHFLFFTFASALMWCSLLALRNRERPGWREAVFGVCIGVPNFYASRFLLQALVDVPAVIAYPVRGVGGIMLVTLAGVALFGERLKKRQWLAMGVIAAAVTLLNLK